MVSTTLLPTTCIGVVHMLYPSWKAEFLDPVCACVWSLAHYWCSWFILHGVYITVILYTSSWMNCFAFSNDIYSLIIIVECSTCTIHVKEFDLQFVAECCGLCMLGF